MGGHNFEYMTDEDPFLRFLGLIKELKGFHKVFLQPGQSQTVTIQLNQRSFAYFNTNTRARTPCQGPTMSWWAFIAEHAAGRDGYATKTVKHEPIKSATVCLRCGELAHKPPVGRRRRHIVSYSAHHCAGDQHLRRKKLRELLL
jgi:fibronectin type III domain protein